MSPNILRCTEQPPRRRKMGLQLSAAGTGERLCSNFVPDASINSDCLLTSIPTSSASSPSASPGEPPLLRPV